MNEYLKNLNRLEFAVTFSCSGKCRHCSQGSHPDCPEHIDGDAAAGAVHKICQAFQINSLMTFGGEPLLYSEAVCKIHKGAKRSGIPKRQIITNGYFSRDPSIIRKTASRLAESGVNELLLSVDAFHQETIPLEPVKIFAEAVREAGIFLRTHPAWLVSREDGNPYNEKTREILKEFAQSGIRESSGNIIFPSGNAARYLSEYFREGELPPNPYEEDPRDVRAICISPSGDVLGGNIYRTDIMELIDAYRPAE